MSETPSQLDAFLSSGAQPEATDTPAPQESKAPPEAAPDSGGSGNKNKPPADKAAPEPDDDGEPGDPSPNEAIVPRSAYEKERARRQDWKSRAVAVETEMALLKQQLEEAKKAPPPQSTPPAMLEPIDPARDPEGYTRRVRGVVLNERLNTSEMMALDKHGKEVIDAETEYFQKRTQQDPRLWNELYSKPHPYQWMIDNNATARLHEEIGTDPAAYRARIAAEERAKWEAEGGAAQRVSPAAGLPPSLASARSAAPRGTNGFAGPPSLADILTRPARR
jgi:hypothetical protein